MSRKMLEGLKVADFTGVIAGPLTTKPLASYGATVLKIEGRGHPDMFRGQAVPPAVDSLAQRDAQPWFNPWLNRSATHALWNTSKLSIAINLALPRGRELAKRFVAWSDVVTENFAGGAMKRMGLGYEDLKEIKPDLIMLSSCMQGQTGPHYAHPGYGTQLANLAGFASISGWPDRDPSAIGAYTDYVAPRFSLLAIMAALDYRRRTGRGQYIDLSQFESGLQYMAPLLLETATNGNVSERVGNFSPYAAPHGVYPCRPKHTDDRLVMIAIHSDEEWVRFCEEIGNPEWTTWPEFSTRRDRRRHREALDKLVEAWTLQYLPDQVVRRLREAEIWAEVPEDPKAWYEHEPPIQGRSPYGAPHGIYRCHAEDRWCSIAVFTEEEWRSFCQVIGNPSWCSDPRFAALSSRVANAGELDRRVAEWTATHTAEDVMLMLQEAGIAAGILQTGEDLMEKDPQLRLRQLYRPVNHPEIGTIHGVAPSFILSEYEAELTRPPLMGEHNEYALKEFLGMSDQEIDELIDEGVIE